MKVFMVTKNGRRGEWFDDSPLIEPGPPSAFTLPDNPEITVHLSAHLRGDDVEPEHFGEDAILFCTGRVNGEWEWHMLLGANGAQRGMKQGWLEHPILAPKVIPPPSPEPKLPWWKRLFR